MKHNIVALLILLFGCSIPAQAALPADTGGQPLPTLAPMLQNATPGVVNISTRGTVQVQQSPLFNDPFFRRFFNMPEGPQEREVSSLGSGVVVDSEQGYVLTNHHVIQRADEISVTLEDGREFNAEVVGTDEATDIALLQIEADNLAALPLGDSDQLRVGDFVVAIGNPFRLGHTVTSGIVSGLGRALGMRGGDAYEDFIQTDAAINRGNSGGALVNLRGELVGINTAILAGQTGGNIGIGFAIPVNMARQVMDQLVEHGTVRRGMLGVNIQNLNTELADALGIDETRGALVSNVMPGSAAERAGLKVHDVIVRVNNKPVRNANELRNLIGLMQIGQEVQLEIIRDGKRQSLTAEIGEVVTGEVAAEDLHPGLHGAVFSDIPESSPLYGRVEGAMVTEVEPRSNAARTNLRPNDVIVSINRQPVRNVADLRRLASPEHQRLLVNVRRGNGAFVIVLQQ